VGVAEVVALGAAAASGVGVAAYADAGG